jgi:hypothetical protein
MMKISFVNPKGITISGDITKIQSCDSMSVEITPGQKIKESSPKVSAENVGTLKNSAPDIKNPPVKSEFEIGQRIYIDDINHQYIYTTAEIEEKNPPTKNVHGDLVATSCECKYGDNKIKFSYDIIPPSGQGQEQWSLWRH